MPRTSIARLMAVVLFIAVGLAAAMAGAFTFAVVTLSAATLGALLARGRGRAFFMGCAAVGWASMLLFFATDTELRRHLPTTHPIIRVYESIDGPGPATFPSPEEASRYVVQLAVDVNHAVTTGHALISLAAALIGGAATWLTAWLIAGRRNEQVTDSTGNLEP